MGKCGKKGHQRLQKFAPLPLPLCTLGQLSTPMVPARMRSWHANSLGTIVQSATKWGSGSVKRGTKRSTPTKSMVCRGHVRGFINARCGLRKHRLQWYLREFEWRHNTEGCLFASMCTLIEKRGFMATPNNRRCLNHGPYWRTPSSDTKVAPKRALSAAPAPKAKRRL